MTASGMKAMATFSTNLRDLTSVLKVDSTLPMRWRYSQQTARMAPAWMAISKTSMTSFETSLVKSSKLPARIRCPVDEIGKNSVKPSTSPMMMAFNARMRSIDVYKGVIDRMG